MTLMISLNLLIACILWQSSEHFTHVVAKADTKPKIGIIGAGISGTTTAHFLRHLFGENADINVFEEKEVGGRMAMFSMGGRVYETGGTIIHPDNFYMVNFTKMLGLSHRDSQGHKLGLYDGTNMVFEGSKWSVLMVLKLFWHYGMDVYHVNNYVTAMLDHFRRIYNIQDQGHCFSTVENLLNAMSPSFVDDLHQSVEKKLESLGYSRLFIDELVFAAMHDNYGQTTDLHSFVGSVSLAGVQPGLWAIRGGNKQVPEGLLKLAGAKLIKSPVTKVTRVNQDNVKYKVAFRNSENKKAEEETYDILVVAAPLQEGMSSIKFDGFKKEIGNFPGKFHRTVANFIQGEPNIKKFGYTNIADYTDMIITTNKTLFFNTLARQTPVDYKSSEPNIANPVWKVFSQKPLTSSELDELFVSREKMEMFDWWAYPHYSSDQKNIPAFVLDTNLYYVNAIELAASAMEMGAIGGRNVALLAYNNWHQQKNLIDRFDKNSQNPEKSEL